MSVRYFFCSITFFLFTSFIATARTGSISGMIIDDAGAPIAAANVFLLRAADSVLVTTDIADENGKYQFSQVADGQYLIRATSLGFTDVRYGPVTVAGNEVPVPDIKMQPAGKQLKEAVVTAQKPFIEVHADKLVVNVENSIVSTGSSVLEVLSRSPGVTVDQNDNISLKGKPGVNIMIDGRMVPMSSADLANMLKSMPSNTVDKIEIITNPSAKYDAAGTAGIINIKTKKDQRMGMNGSVTGGYSQGVYGKRNGGFSLNYREKKVSIYANYNAAFNDDFHHVKWTRKYFSNDTLRKSYEQENNSKLYLNSQNASLGVDYKLSSKTTLGASFTGGNFYLGIVGDYKGNSLDPAGTLIYHFVTANDANGNWSHFSPNVHLQHTFDSTGKDLTIDADYGRYWNKNNQFFTTDYTAADGTLTQPEYKLNGTTNGLTQIRSMKADYTDPLKNNARLEAGVKTSFVTADNDVRFYDRSSGGNVPVTNRSDHFIYNENINAAYINVSKDWEKWSTQLGLRGEQTNISGEEKITGQTLSNSYFQLFPSLALQNHINKNNDLGVTLSRRIERPSYQDLNPYILFVDPTTQKEGNPYIRPALTYSVDLSHVYKQRLVTSVSYSVTNDVITEAVYPKNTGTDTVTIQSKKNLQAQYFVGLSGAYTIPVFKWWTSITSFDVFYSKFKGDLSNTTLNEGKMAFDINTSNKFTFPHDWSAEVTFFYQSAQIYGFLNVEPYYMLNLGVQKNLLNKRLTIKFSANDILYTAFQNGSSYFNGYTQVFYTNNDTRHAGLSLTYRFGKNTVAPVRRHNSGAEDEQRRVGKGGA